MHKMHGKYARMVGWYMASKRIKTKKGEIMKFLSLEDLSDTFEAVLFPRAYERYAAQTLSLGPFLVEGRIDIEGGNNLVVDKLQVLAATELKAALQKDSVENNYYVDAEKVNEADFTLAEKLDQKKLIRAYAG